MASLRRAERVALGMALAGAVIVPPLLLALAQPRGEAARRAPAFAPLAVPSPAEVGAVYDRALFAAVAEGDAPPADAPQLIGVVGRLGADAVALVRAADGTTHSLAPGQGVDGWRLVSLSPDAAYFARGNRRARLAIPNADAPPAPDDSGTDDVTATDQ